MITRRKVIHGANRVPEHPPTTFSRAFDVRCVETAGIDRVSPSADYALEIGNIYADGSAAFLTEEQLARRALPL